MISHGISLILSLVFVAQIFLIQPPTVLGFYLERTSNAASLQSLSPRISGIELSTLTRRRRGVVTDDSQHDVTNVHYDVRSGETDDSLLTAGLRNDDVITGLRSNQGRQKYHHQQQKRDENHLEGTVVGTEGTVGNLAKSNHRHRLMNKHKENFKSTHNNNKYKQHKLHNELRTDEGTGKDSSKLTPVEEVAHSRDKQPISVNNEEGISSASSNGSKSRFRRTTETVMVDRREELERQIERLERRLDILEHQRLQHKLVNNHNKNHNLGKSKYPTHSPDTSRKQDLDRESDDVSDDASTDHATGTDDKRAELAPFQMMDVPDHDFRVRPRFYPDDGPKRNWKTNLMRVWG